jgi:hypothetical protein
MVYFDNGGGGGQKNGGGDGGDRKVVNIAKNAIVAVVARIDLRENLPNMLQILQMQHRFLCPKGLLRLQIMSYVTVKVHGG